MKAMTISLTPPPLSPKGRGERRESLRDFFGNEDSEA
jgi:hypothetical protein